MASSLFVHGELHTPYYIFVRCCGTRSHGHLLRRLGLSDYRRVLEPPRFGPYAILADAGDWTLIADDWLYTLWHRPTTRPAIAALAEHHDVFACSVGDCDRSFDFVYYRNSRLVREYVVDDPHFRGGEVVENFGEPLPGEADSFQNTGELAIVLGIAASLGIKTHYAEQDIRIYAP